MDKSTEQQHFHSVSSVSSSSSTPSVPTTTDIRNINPSSVSTPDETLPNITVKGPQPLDRLSKHKYDDEKIPEDDEISIQDASGSSTSTPTPPEEYAGKLYQAEAMIQKLRKENHHQRKEVR